MNTKKAILLLIFTVTFSYAQIVKDNLDPNIRSIFQDKKGNYWFGTNAAGVYR